IVLNSGAKRTVREITMRIRDMRDFRMWQRRTPEHQDQMETDGKTWIRQGQLDRLIKSNFINHKTCAGQDSFAMGSDDCAVDRFGITEIIAIDGQWNWFVRERTDITIHAL